MKRVPIVEGTTLELTSSRSVVAALWATAVFLSLLFAPEVSTWIVHDTWLSNQPWAVAAARALDTASEATRIRSVHDGIVKIAARAGASGNAPAPALVAELRTVPASASAGVAAPQAPNRKAHQLLTDERPVRRILLVGESSIQFYLGSELERLLRSSYRDVVVKRFGKLATSLVRNDVLDWRAKTTALVDEFRPDVVIANFGGNDAQNIVTEKGDIVKFGTALWDREFAERVSGLARVVKERGARLVMIGMPAMRDRSFSRRMKRVNGIVREQMERLGETYLSSWELTADAEGEYRKAVTIDGTTGLMRLSDGKHYSKLGARVVAEHAIERLERRFLIWPSDPALSLTVSREMDSAALNQRASYIAYVPQETAQGRVRVPVLFLLHGSGGSFQDWPDHAHRNLQRLSSSHSLIIVAPEGGADGWYLDSPLVPGSQYESHLIKEVVPDVDRRLPSNRVRGIGGLSAGGNGAIALALKHPGIFRSASSMSGTVDLSQAADRPALIERLGPYPGKRQLWQGNSARHLLARRPDVARRIPMLITVGSSDRWAPANRALTAELTDLGVEHVFEETQGEHDWSYWTEQVAKHVAWHAKTLASDRSAPRAVK